MPHKDTGTPHVHRSAAPRPNRRAYPFRRADERSDVPAIHRTDTRPYIEPRGHRHLRQPLQPQKFGGARSPPRGRSRYHLSAPYRPDMNPIEMVFSKIKAYLRAHPSESFERIVQRLAESLDSFSETICSNFLTHAKYSSS